MDRHELVMAPAGAGKTTLIANTINDLLDKGVSADRILCITFTNLACRNMRRSVHDDVLVSTIHSLIYNKVIKKLKYSIADDSCEHIILENILINNGYSDYDASKSINSLCRAIKKYSLMCLYLTKDKSYDDYISLIGSDSMNSYFASKSDGYRGLDTMMIGKYFKELLKYYDDNSIIDFDSIIIRGIFDCRLDVDYIFIDEFQDILYQEYLAAISINSNACIKMYGDVNQSIYEWRGASPGYILKQFKKQYVPKETYLDTIYRSKGKIVELGNQLIGNSDNTYSYTQSGGDVKCVAFDNPTEEMNYIASMVEQDLVNNKRVAVLSRTNGTIKPYIDLFRSKGVKFHSKTPSSYKGDPCVNICLQMLGLRAEKFNDSRFHNILYSEILLKHSGVKASDLNSMNIRKYPLQLFTIGPRYYYPLVDRVCRFGKTLVVFDVESTGLEIGVDRIIQISGIKLDDNFNIVDEIDIIINPEKSVGDSEKTHHFSDSYLQSNGVSSLNGLGRFLEFVGDSIMIGHNVNYDKSMLECECRRVGLELPDLCYYDSLSIARFVLDCDSYKLGDLINYLGIDANPNHNAMEDVRATVKLVVELSSRLRNALNAFELCYKPSEVVSNYINYIRDMVNESMSCEIVNVIRTVNRYLIGMHISKTDRWHIVNLNDNVLSTLNSTGVNNDYSLYAELQLSALPSSLDRQLSILTVHQSKGLEWDSVYLVGCNTKYSQSNEDMRIEYVATTRAKESLCVSCIDYLSSSRIVDVVRSFNNDC